MTTASVPLQPLFTPHPFTAKLRRFWTRRGLIEPFAASAAAGANRLIADKVALTRTHACLPRPRRAAASRRSHGAGPLRRPRRPRWHAERHDDVRLRPGLARHRLRPEHLRSGVRARPLRRRLLSVPSGLDGHVVPGPCPSVLPRLQWARLVRRRRLPLRGGVDWQRLLAVALPGRLSRALRGRRRVRVRRRPHRRRLLGLALRRRLRRPRHLRGARTLRVR